MGKAMTLKIASVLNWVDFDNDALSFEKKEGDGRWVRIIRESDWRKVLAVLRAAEAWYCKPVQDFLDDNLMKSVDALKEHLKK